MLHNPPDARFPAKSAHAGGGIRVAGASKVFTRQGACTGICHLFTMHALSLNDDRNTGEGNPQKAQGGGSRNKSNNSSSRKKRTVQLFESVSFE
jgi:hypothetical protein